MEELWNDNSTHMRTHSGQRSTHTLGVKALVYSVYSNYCAGGERRTHGSSNTVSAEPLGTVEKRNVFFKDPLVVLSHWEIRTD